MSTKPLLSICIPTYNRASILKESLRKITSYKSFDKNVELVISDNCSTDNTQEVCKAFVAEYDNIRYYRNQENIHDRNFISVLDKGNGDYLKLQNDWCYPTEEGLSFMKFIIHKYKHVQMPVFFVNRWACSGHRDMIVCNNLDEYIEHVSVMVTFNNLFGSWRQTWNSIGQKEKYATLKLQQVDWTYRIVSGKGALICNQQVFELSMEMRKVVRQGYNYFEVLLDNYYTIMQNYADQQLIRPETIKKDKIYFLRHFRPELFQALICHTAHYWKFDTSGTFSRLFRHYRHEPYFYWFLVTLPFQWLLHASVRDFGR